MIFVAEAAAWWTALVGIWITTLASVTWPEVWVAAAAALPCAIVTVVVRRVLGERWRPGLRPLGWLFALPGAVLVDTLRVLVLPPGAARRQPRTRDLRRIRLPADAADARAATSLAAATALVSATPATVVVDSRPDERQLVLHTLAGGAPDVRPDMSKVVSE
jgi:hypothetical protein